MNGEQARQMLELLECIVRGTRSRSALLAVDTHADVGHLDHAHVVGAVADGQTLGAGLSQQRDHLGLLQWRHTAAEHRLAHAGQLQKLSGTVAQRQLECTPVDHHRDLVVGERVATDVVAQLADHSGGVCGVHHCQQHVGVDQLRRVADADGRLDLVAGNHPHADAGIPQVVDGLGHTRRELILDAGAAAHREPDLQLRLQVLLRLLAVLQRLRDLLVAAPPLGVLRFAQLSLGQHQRAQAHRGELVGGVAGHLRRRSVTAAARQHLVVRSLAVEHQTALW
mmetsp:Transcript_17490/g.44562  ORF Transcript_17490/g.44562 Transcript_17490/m.44562 type:complete len:281 (-) Transcript_17490:2442-3284(-)